MCRYGRTSAAGPGVHVGPGDRALRAAVRAEHRRQPGDRPVGGLPDLRVQLPGRLRVLRRYYATLDPAAVAFFPSAGESAASALASTGLRAGMLEMFFTSASMIAVVTSILVGAGVALLLDVAGVPLPAAVIAGVAAALLAYGLHMLWMYRRSRPAMA